MLVKLEECSLLNKKDNLGNAVLKQGKKFNKYSGIVKSNRKVANKSNKVKNDFSLDGYLIEGFGPQDVKDIDTALFEINNIITSISGEQIPSYTTRYEINDLSNYTVNTAKDNLQGSIGLKLDTDTTGRVQGNKYSSFVNEVSGKIDNLKSDISKNTLKIRNRNEDELFDIIQKKKQEYNQLKSTEVLNGQLNNTQLTNKSYYLQYIIWLVAAISMGGLVLKKVFNN